MNAQNNDHLTFKDIPINGDIDSFVKRMESVGYVKEKQNKNIVIMSGSFVNLNCEIYIAATPETNIIYKVIVFAPKDESWNSLESDYRKFKTSYAEKYGKPESYEFFSFPYYKGDGYETQALRKDKCTYSSFWALNNGTIMVSIILHVN